MRKSVTLPLCVYTLVYLESGNWVQLGGAAASTGQIPLLLQSLQPFRLYRRLQILRFRRLFNDERAKKKVTVRYRRRRHAVIIEWQATSAEAAKKQRATFRKQQKDGFLLAAVRVNQQRYATGVKTRQCVANGDVTTSEEKKDGTVPGVLVTTATIGPNKNYAVQTSSSCVTSACN